MREPTDKMVETLEPCVLWKFQYDKLEVLFTKNHVLAQTARLFSNYGIALVEKRFDSLHFYTAKERYDILLNEQPDILKRVSLGIIASYLGITQKTLSRIRRQQ